MCVCVCMCACALSDCHDNHAQPSSGKHISNERCEEVGTVVAANFNVHRILLSMYMFGVCVHVCVSLTSK